MVDENQNQAGEPADAAEKQKRDRSTIEFPYSDLDSAIEIARKIYENAGTSCEVTQLAGWLDQSATGGTFRSRLSAARLFGLVETERGGAVNLAPLGRDILDGTKGPAARVSAFLKVELYAKLYEMFQGRNLPPAAALERQAVNLGVAEKQADRARQVFTKSAQQAGFINQATGRFVKPGVAGRTEPEGGDDVPERGGGNGGGGAGGGGGGGDQQLDSTLQGLVDRIPRGDGAKWPLAERAKWHRALASVAEIVFGDDEDGQIEIHVKRAQKSGGGDDAA